MILSARAGSVCAATVAGNSSAAATNAPATRSFTTPDRQPDIDPGLSLCDCAFRVTRRQVSAPRPAEAGMWEDHLNRLNDLTRADQRCRAISRRTTEGSVTQLTHDPALAAMRIMPVKRRGGARNATIVPDTARFRRRSRRDRHPGAAGASCRPSRPRPGSGRAAGLSALSPNRYGYGRPCRRCGRAP